MKLLDKSDKEIKEIALENAEVEQANLWNRHEKFRGGKFDEDIEVLAAEMATFLLDPYYIFMYMTPWGRAMSMRQQGLKPIAKFAGFSAGTISLDKLFPSFLKLLSLSLNCEICSIETPSIAPLEI